MNQLNKNPATRAVWLSAIVALSLSLGGCWEAIDFFFGEKEKAQDPSKVVVNEDYLGGVNEARRTITYADGHQKLIHTRSFPKETTIESGVIRQKTDTTVVIFNADGSLRSGPAEVDRQTIDKQIQLNRIKHAEEAAARSRRFAEDYRSGKDRPSNPHYGAEYHDRYATENETEAQRFRLDYIERFGEVPPSPSIDEMLGVGSARPTGVTGAGAFTPPQVPTGPPPGAIVRPPPRPPMPIPHID